MSIDNESVIRGLGCLLAYKWCYSTTMPFQEPSGAVFGCRPRYAHNVCGLLPSHSPPYNDNLSGLYIMHNNTVGVALTVCNLGLLQYCC